MTARDPLAWLSGAAVALLLGSLSGCRATCPPTLRCGQGLETTKATIMVGLPERAGGGHLVVENVPDDAALWYHVQGACFARLAPPPVSLLVVDSLAVSPDGRFVAVISVGEGHPVLDVLDLGRVLGSSHGEQVLATVNPYPGWIALEGWRDGGLQVSSDRPLPACCDLTGGFESQEILEEPRSFLLDPSNGSWTGR